MKQNRIIGAFTIIAIGLFASLSAMAAAINYWDTDGGTAGLQPGNGVWDDGITAAWSTAIGGTALVTWDNAGTPNAIFETSGASTVTVSTVTANSLTFNGSGYLLTNGTLTVGAGGMTVNEDAIIHSSTTLALDGSQIWDVALDKAMDINTGIGNVENVTKTGGGTVYLDGRTIALQGTITVNEGTLFCRGGGWYAPLWEDLSPRVLTVNTNGILSNDTHGMGGTGYIDSPTPIITLESGTWRLDGTQEVRSDHVVLNGGLITGNGIWRAGGGTMIVNAHANTSLIDGSGAITLYANVTHDVADGAADPDLRITRNITQSGTHSLTKTGAGTMVLDGASTYADPTTVEAGTLGGNGSLSSPITIAAGATLAPGSTEPGIFTVNSDVTLSASSTFKISYDGGAAGVKQSGLVANGSVTLDDAILDVSDVVGPMWSTELFIIVNDGASPVVGTFTDLAQDAQVILGGGSYTGLISYVGNAASQSISGGNDVVIYGLSDETPSRYWDTSTAAGLQPGDGTWSTNALTWSDTINGSPALLAWQNGVVDAYFEVGGGSTVAVDTVIAESLIFNGDGYVLTNGTLAVGVGGITASESATLDSTAGVALNGAQTWSAASEKTLTVNGGIDTSGHTLTIDGGGDVYHASGGNDDRRVTGTGGVTK